MVNGRVKYKIKDVFDLSAGGDVDRNHFSTYKTSEHRYPIFSNSLENHGLYGYTSSPRYCANSVTITGRGSVGHAEYRQEAFDAIIRLLVLEPKDNRVYPRFVADFINNCVGFPLESTGVPQLTAPQIMNIELELPQYGEQKEIADLLADVNRLIEMLEKQLTKKRAIKQGAMQELLTGKRRLPGFNGAWREVRLEDICSKITDGSHESPPESDVGYYMPSVKDMTSTGFDYSECKKISYADFKKLERNGCRPDIGDVLIAKDGSILKYAFVQEQTETIVILSSIAIVKPLSNCVDSFFLAQYFRQQNFVEQVITNYKSGTGVPRIVLKGFKEIELFIPESVAEQAAIAKILVDMDKEIAGLEKKLGKYRQVKQGMMQQLLTGKIRLA